MSSIYEVGINLNLLVEKIPHYVVLGNILPYVESEVVQEIVKIEAYRSEFFGGFLPILKDKFCRFDFRKYMSILIDTEKDSVSRALDIYRSKTGKWNFYLSDVKLILNMLTPESACCMSAYYGFEEHIDKAVQFGPASALTYHRNSPLRLALKTGHIRIVKTLLSKLEISISARNQAIVDAVENLSSLKLLAEKWGLPVLEIIQRDSNLLYGIFHKGHLDIVNFVVTLMLSFRESIEPSTLHFAVSGAVCSGRVSIVEHLIENFGYDPSNMTSHLIASVCKKDSSILDYLLTCGYKWDADDIKCAFKRAIRKDQFRNALKLSEKGCINPEIMFKFCYQNDKLDEANKIYEKFDIDPSFENNLFLRKAIEEHRKSIIMKLFSDPRVTEKWT